MIASIAFRNFKALRATRVTLGAFNLVIGPNGSGKTSLIEALLRLRTLSKLAPAPAPRGGAGPEIEFTFTPPHDGVIARLGCISEDVCNVLEIAPMDAPHWPALQEELAQIRSYVLDHAAMVQPAPLAGADALSADGANVAAVLARMQRESPEVFTGYVAEVLRLMPEFRSVELVEHRDARVDLALRLRDNGVVPASEMSQGMRYLLAILALAFDRRPPRVLCIEEIDRGVHPRMLREVRDALYRLSHPESFGLTRRPVQIVTTTHSPYFIDLFRDHPEEVVISHKQGRAARFERLSDRPDIAELLREGSLGDMWYSGILGGVPEE